MLSTKTIQQAGKTENVRLSIGNSAAILIVRVNTAKENKTAKVMRIK